jgi:hypothetical protein
MRTRACHSTHEDPRPIEITQTPKFSSLSILFPPVTAQRPVFSDRRKSRQNQKTKTKAWMNDGVLNAARP